MFIIYEFFVKFFFVYLIRSIEEMAGVGNGDKGYLFDLFEIYWV